MTRHRLYVRLAETLYRIARPWGDVPMGVGAPSDVGCDRDGNVYCQVRQDPYADAAGPATVEAYSVMHDRSGAPERVIASCLLADGRRAWGDSRDADLGREMCAREWVGAAVSLDADGVLHAG